MDAGCVLVSIDNGRLVRCRVASGPARVPWADGVRAEPGRGGVVLAGPGLDAGGTSRLLAPGATAVLGGRVTSCLAIERSADGAEAAALGPDLVAASEAMVRVLHLAACLAPLPDPVTLLGESGTGKELVARAIHRLGRPTERPFVAVNLAALPLDLVEAELFGWVRGSFTGAADSRPGAFESAAGGTLFLDEVTEAPVSVQAKLLRAVETGEVRRLGASRATGPGCRVVAATNRDLGSAVGAGIFRLDLVERLACLVVRLPPLRCRPEDLAPLARRLCRRMPERPEPDAATLDALAAYDWPGNVRELRNVLRRAAVLSPGGRLDAGAVRESIAAGRLVRQEPAFPVAMGCAEPPPPPGWGRPSRAKAIAESGMPRSTYYYRLKRGRIPGVF